MSKRIRATLRRIARWLGVATYHFGWTHADDLAVYASTYPWLYDEWLVTGLYLPTVTIHERWTDRTWVLQTFGDALAFLDATPENNRLLYQQPQHVVLREITGIDIEEVVA